ncbi:phage tail tube protein [Enterovibrio norvegicus]|uniref:Phage tail protein n=1 Tax=Enterovibrio norvegicus TaxID=188144 RepID=A0A2N7LAC4_9GAMM|nr:phage tail tube protein [Enterovibrio norvegicus]PMN91377.1 phage tail protein [Enterovibrio norvegicus]
MSILGYAKIRANGDELKTKGGARLNPGGFNRTSHGGGGRVWGNSKRFVAPSLDFKLVVDSDTDVQALNDMENVTIVFEADNGLTYMMTGSALENPAELDEDNGETGGKFIGKQCKRI